MQVAMPAACQFSLMRQHVTKVRTLLLQRASPAQRRIPSAASSGTLKKSTARTGGLPPAHAALGTPSSLLAAPPPPPSITHLQQALLVITVPRKQALELVFAPVRLRAPWPPALLGCAA